MNPRVAAKSSPNWIVPGVLIFASLAITIYGLFGRSEFIGFGFVLFSGAVVVTMITRGASTSMMDTTCESKQNEHEEPISRSA